MNVYHLWMVYISIFTLSGPVVLAYFLPDDVASLLIFDASNYAFDCAFSSSIYAAIVFFLSYFFLFRKGAIAYQLRGYSGEGRYTLLFLWKICIFSTCFIIFILFYQNGFSVPVLEVSGLDERSIQTMRIEIANSTNIGLYNVGLRVFSAISILTALLMRDKLKLFIAILLTLLLCGFNLQKSPIVDLFYQLLVFGLLYKKLSAFLFVLLCIAVIAVMIVASLLTSDADISNVLVLTIQRLSIGSWAALPSYFDIFHDRNFDITYVLPGYLLNFLDVVPVEVGRVVMVQVVKSELLDATGVANTHFMGSAYAFFGVYGVLLSPFIVIINIMIVTAIFNRLEKNFVNLFFYSMFIYRLTVQVTSSISFYLISSTQIMLLVYVFFIYVYQYMKIRKVSLSTIAPA